MIQYGTLHVIFALIASARSEGSVEFAHINLLCSHKRSMDTDEGKYEHLDIKLRWIRQYAFSHIG